MGQHKNLHRLVITVVAQEANFLLAILHHLESKIPQCRTCLQICCCHGVEFHPTIGVPRARVRLQAYEHVYVYNNNINPEYLFQKPAQLRNTTSETLNSVWFVFCI